MTTIPSYDRNPTLTRLETEVLETGEESGRPFVVLSDTVLYPEGGGQPADRGILTVLDERGAPRAEVAVVDVRKVAGAVRHVLAAPPPAAVGFGGGAAAEAGTRVVVELDWARRFDHMQQHTAQHLLTAVADARFGWHTTAFHLGEHVSDIELDTPAIAADKLAQLEELVAAEIRAARPVVVHRVTSERYATMAVRSRGLPEGHVGDVRLVEIQGVDLNTCGGTHCASTAEIEALKLLGTESVRGGTRLFWAAGRRLRRRFEEHHLRAARLRELLGASDDEVPERVAQKLGQLRDAEHALRDLEEELAMASAAALAAGPGPLLSAHWPERGVPFLQRVARETARLAPEGVVFLTAGSEGSAGSAGSAGSGGAGFPAGAGGAFVLAAGEAASLDVAAAGRHVAGLLGGRGGGSGRIFQGKAPSLGGRDAAVAWLEAACRG